MARFSLHLHESQNTIHTLGPTYGGTACFYISLKLIEKFLNTQDFQETLKNLNSQDLGRIKQFFGEKSWLGKHFASPPTSYPGHDSLKKISEYFREQMLAGIEVHKELCHAGESRFFKYSGMNKLRQGEGRLFQQHFKGIQTVNLSGNPQATVHTELYQIKSERERFCNAIHPSKHRQYQNYGLVIGFVQTGHAVSVVYANGVWAIFNSKPESLLKTGSTVRFIVPDSPVSPIATGPDSASSTPEQTSQLQELLNCLEEMYPKETNYNVDLFVPSVVADHDY